MGEKSNVSTFPVIMPLCGQKGNTHIEVNNYNIINNNNNSVFIYLCANSTSK
jgi:hypothetical protein